MARFYTYLLSCALLLGMGACSDESEETPQPGGRIDANWIGTLPGGSNVVTAYCPLLMTRSVLEQSVAAEAPQAMHNTGKIYLRGRYVFVNERYEGVHVIDNQDPKNPRIVSFLRIPGNVDIAIKDNLLYADNGPDLVTIDISNPKAVTVVSRVRDAFRELPVPNGMLHPECYASKRPDNTVIVGWQEKETIMANNPAWNWRGMTLANSPAFFSADRGMSGTGKAGSLARFAVLDETLYTVDESSLRLFDLASPTTPVAGPKLPLMFGVETIFPYDHYLFLGTQRGMYIYDVATPKSPRQVSYFQHVLSCDPVVVDDRFAYLTLRSGPNSCRNGVNELQVIDLTTLSNPKLMRTYPMTGPQGLGVDKDQLFVCDSDGLKTFDTSQSPSLTQKQHYKVAVTDVIPNNGTLLAIGANGLYQYSYAGAQLQQLSFLPITKK
ncbi:hypothetical protein GCM10011375_27790 [Hymenobacter qilianensis]|uniref:Uncharacterized protein n=2 Tax=Hymenobacter qilianensis TaxID=1385715 RepID=A0ACB5PTP9_9BACT|nr:hypothetical protein [Hymenobacter qilianensis]QNP52830.1 hypothetical protein H9L05_03645 [Hymenobacter qilianensis]GGF71079.1 hypothetical protein GCM10011375_27790 [Hymenobacter qilianensis]